MKRLLGLMLALLLVLTGCISLAEVDNRMLEEAADMNVFVEDDGVNLVIRPLTQPYIGQTDQEDVEAVVYLDLVEMPNEGATVVRLMLCLNGPTQVNGRELRLAVGSQTYVFNMNGARSITEYDLTYFEDYAIGMTDLSLPMVKAMARQKSDTYQLTLSGDMTVTVTVDIPGDEVARIYDLYVQAGGAQQDLEILRDLWPCTVSK